MNHKIKICHTHFSYKVCFLEQTFRRHHIKLAYYCQNNLRQYKGCECLILLYYTYINYVHICIIIEINNKRNIIIRTTNSVCSSLL